MRARLLPILFLITFSAAKAFSPPDTVKAGAYVISVHDINFHDKEYTMRFWLWFIYSNPQFNFAKQLDIPNAKSIEDPEILPDSLGKKAWVILKMKSTMKENWNVSDFPFDEQHLSVHIENTLFDRNSLVFEPDIEGSKYDPQDAIDGWKIKNFKVSTGITDYHTGFGDKRQKVEHFSAFNIEMDIERNAWGLFMKIFIGMYISFFIALISFVPHPSELEPRFGLPVGGLFAAVGNKYIIDSLLPESSLFTLVDTLHALTFFGIFATLVVSAICLVYHDKGNSKAAEEFNRTGARIVVISYFMLNLIFIIEAIY